MIGRQYGRVVNNHLGDRSDRQLRPGQLRGSKAGVAAFTKSLAKELAGKGITVNRSRPASWRLTNGDGDPREGCRPACSSRSRSGDSPGRRSRARRGGVYIVSADGDYITGAELSINGGLLM